MNLKTLVLLGIFSSSLLVSAAKMPELHFNPSPRKIKIETKNKQIFAENGKIYFGIVVPDDAGGPAKLAAEELANFLGKSLNAKIPVASKRDPKWKHAIILGDSALSRKAGIDLSKVSRDGFLMRTIGNDIYIAGVDDKNADTKKIIPKSHYWGEEPMMHQRGTVFGAYDFLERFVGIRFYMPNKIGTIVPKLKKLEIPSVDIFDRPDCVVRTTTGFGLMRIRHLPWMDTDQTSRVTGNYALLRMRGGTRNIPNCHGLQMLGYWVRFGKTNPEYFVQNIKGKRQTGHPGFICLSSDITKEIIEDAKSALRGEPPQKRGIVWSNGKSFTSYWFPMVYNKDGFFNVHLMDGMQPCYCEKCKDHPYNPDLVWKMTADVAKAVKASGINAWITQMGYAHYKEVPAIDLPDNVIVQLAFNGPYQWSEKEKFAEEKNLIRKWNRKLGGKNVWLWVYLDATEDPKSSPSFYYPGISQNCPYTIHKYFSSLKGEISGSFLELIPGTRDLGNLYICMKVLWNNSLDINAEMEEYYRLMFGKAAPLMKSYFVEAENIWINKVRSKSFDTIFGPKPMKQPFSKIWEEYYPPQLLKKWERMFNQAEALVKNSPEQLARVKFFRKHYLDPALKYSAEYWNSRGQTEILQANVPAVTTPVVIDGKLDEAVWKKSELHYLGKFRFGGITPIRAAVRVLRDEKNLYFGFESIDPEHGKLETGKNRLPGQDLATFATFEVMMNPSGDKENVTQFMITPAGLHLGIQHPKATKFTTGYKVATSIGSDRWTAELAVPLAMLKNMKKGGFPANFSYNRQLKNTPPCSDLYSWSPYLTRMFLEPDHFAKLVLGDDKGENLLDEYDFNGLVRRGRVAGTRWGLGELHKESKIYLDKTTFVTGGQSICLESTADVGDKSTARIGYLRFPKLIPGKKYRLSMYVKGDLAPGSFADARVWYGKTLVIPSGRLNGTFPWMKISGEFTAIKPGVGFGVTLWGKGKLNVDHIVLQKLD
ncbi:MAG: DUF4838 domain-containing protein [Lentisphaeria bacterium]|nr:DUF4838 domain-containing protein [Lentisphaeria bacterium]